MIVIEWLGGEATDEAMAAVTREVASWGDELDPDGRARLRLEIHATETHYAVHLADDDAGAYGTGARALDRSLRHALSAAIARFRRGSEELARVLAA